MTEKQIQALVTGGAGFIGSHLVESLLENNVHVKVIDNLSSGKPANLEKVRERIDFIEGDIRNRELVEKAAQGCDYIFHLAAVVSVTVTVADPFGSAQVNEMGTITVLEAARKCKARRVILSSSSAVYGGDPQLPKDESLQPCPKSPYAVQKLVNEHYAALYNELYGLETVCLRYFNVYGPRQDPSSPYSGVISIFMKQAVNQKPPLIYGDGKQTRDFVHVSDVVMANRLAARNPSAPGNVFNIGTGRRISINELWEIVAGTAGVNLKPEYRPARRGDIRHSVADISKSVKTIGYRPQVDLAAGLAETYKWYLEGC